MMAEDVSREVDQLLKDRERYEKWLQKLESEKDKAASHAYERVRTDYQRRLGEVVAQLRSHGQTLQNRLSEMETRVAALERERGAHNEKLEEARLRRMVGEFTDDAEWEGLESGLLNELQEAERQLEESRSEIDHLREIVAQVGLDQAEPPAARPAGREDRARAERPDRPMPSPEPARPRGDSGVAPRAEAPPAQKPQPRPEPAHRPQPEPEPEEPPEPSVPETESDEGFLSLEELVLEDKDPEEAMHPGPRSKPAASQAEPAPESLDADEEGESEVGDELAFLESLSLGSSEEAESFSFIEQHGSGTPQTIICPHCSAANDPAEWYCTECGEELPAE